MKVGVIGAGTMGNGIAHVFAMHGHEVKLVDINQDALDRALVTIEKNLDRMLDKEKITADQKQATLQHIRTDVQLSALADADLVVEAATENKKIKLEIIQQLDSICRLDAILASNTSSISITEIAAVSKAPARVIGMHFMNPVPIMKLVEVIRGYDTSDAICKRIMDLSVSLGKVPVEVNDYPGFVANRILMPMINEAIITLNEGVATVEAIDSVMKLGMAHPMGPLQLADFIGLDVCLSIMRVLHDGLGNDKYAPSPLLVNMVMAGHLGRKSGLGFYLYEKGNKDLVVAPKFQ